MFIKRIEETQRLERFFNSLSENSALIGIDGRRRIGKTAFTDDYILNKKMNCLNLGYSVIDLKFVGDFLSSSKSNLETATTKLKHNILHDFYDGFRLLKREKEKLLDKKVKTWNDFFLILSDLISIVKEKKERQTKTFIFFDEFSWFSKKNDFLSAFTHFWNSNFATTPNVMIFVASSNSTWITNKMFKNPKGLYSRFSDIIKLKPFTPKEIKILLDNQFTDEEILSFYLMFGGVPKYYQLINKQLSFEENLNFFNTQQGKENFVYEYQKMFEGLISVEIDEDDKQGDNSNNAISILDIITVLAKSKSLNLEQLKNNLKISNTARSEEVKLVRKLEILQNSSLVISYQENLKKNKIYVLNDLFCLFIETWFNKKARNKNSLATQDQYYSTWKGNAFELFCLQSNILNLIDQKDFENNIYLNCLLKDRVADKNKVVAQIDILIKDNQSKRNFELYNLIELKNYKKGYIFSFEEIEDVFYKAELLEYQRKKAISTKGFKTKINIKFVTLNEAKFSKDVPNLIESYKHLYSFENICLINKIF